MVARRASANTAKAAEKSQALDIAVEGHGDYSAIAQPAPQHKQLATLLDLQRRTKPFSIVEEVERGLRFKVVEKLALALKISISVFAQKYLDMSPSTITRRKADGHLRPLESDRAVRFARLIEQATDLYDGDEETARQWLETPLPALGGSTPLEYTRTETGYREVENLIVALDYGMFS